LLKCLTKKPRLFFRRLQFHLSHQFHWFKYRTTALLGQGLTPFLPGVNTGVSRATEG
jgi:hypothetical protein